MQTRTDTPNQQVRLDTQPEQHGQTSPKPIQNQQSFLLILPNTILMQRIKRQHTCRTHKTNHFITTPLSPPTPLTSQTSAKQTSTEPQMHYTPITRLLKKAHKATSSSSLVALLTRKLPCSDVLLNQLQKQSLSPLLPLAPSLYSSRECSTISALIQTTSSYYTATTNKQSVFLRLPHLV